MERRPCMRNTSALKQALAGGCLSSALIRVITQAIRQGGAGAADHEDWELDSLDWEMMIGPEASHENLHPDGGQRRDRPVRRGPRLESGPAGRSVWSGRRAERAARLGRDSAAA